MARLLTLLSKLVPQRKLDVFGKDSLLSTSLPYYSFVVVMLLGYATFFTQPWFTVALIYSLLPLLD